MWRTCVSCAVWTMEKSRASMMDYTELQIISDCTWCCEEVVISFPWGRQNFNSSGVEQLMFCQQSRISVTTDWAQAHLRGILHENVFHPCHIRTAGHANRLRFCGWLKTRLLLLLHASGSQTRPNSLEMEILTQVVCTFWRRKIHTR